MAVRFEAQAEPVTGYQLLERIGSGGFGEVWKCIAPGGIFKAIKIIHGDLRSKDNDLVRYAEQELKSLERVKQVRHPYLLALDRYDIVDGRLLIVMELADCNLWDRFRQHRLKGIPGIPREELMVYMQETAEVLDLMNCEHGLLHLDIKPQNIFLQWNHVKVGDFGQVKDLQGLAAQVTGGITPVYAAPETFDGIVTRACDQYSLACVYQELLTGIRPFDGTSMNQLLMQHLASPPNLTPSPEADRPALQRALAKRHEDRFANCADFVAALRNGMTTTPANVRANSQTPLPSTISAALLGVDQESEPQAAAKPAASASQVVSRSTTRLSGSTSQPEFMEEIRLHAPPQQLGDGTLQPTFIIGIGSKGLQVLQRIEWELNSRYGKLPAAGCIQYLMIDTDPQTIATCETERSWERLAAIQKDDYYHARLNRSTYYLKWKSNNRASLDDWFDPQLLNKLSRTPTTLGYRPLGRLAFADHYRHLSQLTTIKLATCCDAESLNRTIEATGLELRSNRPRVYVVTSLTGGTGGGMYIDVAYLVRNRLKHLGYTQAEIHAILMVPPDANYDQLPEHARANVYASLTELNHYSRPDTQYHAAFDERIPPIQDASPPFETVSIVADPLENTNTPLNSSTPFNPKRNRLSASDATTVATAANESSRSTAANSGVSLSATRIVWDLIRHVGRSADEFRVGLPDPIGITVRTFGLAEMTWPRGVIIDRTSKILSGVLVTHWVSPDISRARHRIPVWVSEQMQKYGVTRDQLTQSLSHSLVAIANEPFITHIARLCEPLLPKGWLNRSPDVNKLIPVLDKIGKLIGVPTTAKSGSQIHDVLRNAANDIALNATSGLTNAIHELIDNPDFRVAGAQEAIQQITNYLNVSRAECEAELARFSSVARTQYEQLMAYIHPHSGNKRPSTQDISESLRQFPAAQFQACVAYRAAKLYDYLKCNLNDLRASITESCKKLEHLQRLCLAEIEKPCPALDPLQVMPVGCATIEEAAQRYLSVLTDEDLVEVERQVHRGIEQSFGGLVQACANSTASPATILDVVQTCVRMHLNSCLGEVDLESMLTSKYGDPTSTQRAIAESYRMALPNLVGNGPWAKNMLAILGTPNGPNSTSLRDLADSAIPAQDRATLIDTADSICIYREYPQVPLCALPQFGPSWESAYQNATESNQAIAHSRTDVTEWITVDSL